MNPQGKVVLALWAADIVENIYRSPKIRKTLLLVRLIKKISCMQVFNPRSGLCDDQKNVAGCEETYPDEPRELDIEVGELSTSVTIYVPWSDFFCL